MHVLIRSGRLTIIVAALAVAGCSRDVPGEKAIGTPAPDFELPALDGERVRLSELKGSVVVLDFWATWCGPCVESLPHLAEVYREGRDRGVHVYAVNVREEREEVESFLRSAEIDVPVLMDRYGDVAERYDVTTIPYTVVVNRDGEVTSVLSGFGPDSTRRLREAVRRAEKG